MPGMVVAVAVQAGDSVKKGQKLLTLEAMKMETNIAAEFDGKISEDTRQKRQPGRNGRLAGCV